MNGEPNQPAPAPGHGPAWLRYVPSRHAEALWDHDLADGRLSWQPGSVEELWRQVLPWRCERLTAELDGEVVAVVELTNGDEPSWDWRTVSFWAAALGPSWRVHLRHSGRVDLLGPSQPLSGHES